jgi:DNA-directed RNA polymerase specialized sigma24 family protein
MSNQISAQANKLWQTISAQETIATYRQALSLTGAIVRETAILVWLVLCLALVAIDWFWTSSISAGRQFRTWVDGFDKTDTQQFASEAGKALVSASKSSLLFTVSRAREQLGLPEKQEPTLVLPEKQDLKNLEIAEAPSTPAKQVNTLPNPAAAEPSATNTIPSVELSEVEPSEEETP